MSQKKGKIRLPEAAKRGAKIPEQRGYRLVNPNKTRAFKVAVVATYKSKKTRFIVARVS